MDASPGTWLNLPDLLAGVILLVGLAGGIHRGLSGEVSRLVSLTIAVLTAWFLSPSLIPLLESRLAWPAHQLGLAAFVGVFLAAYAVCKLIRFVLHTILDVSFRGPVEWAGGGLLGLARYAVVVVLLFLLAGALPSATVQHHLSHSRIHPLVERHVRPLYDDLAEEVPLLQPPPGGATNLYQDLQPLNWDVTDPIRELLGPEPPSDNLLEEDLTPP
jgi:uncharacterized membrane protein required for colicin V production